MHYSVYDVFYSQFSHHVLTTVVVLRPKHVGEKIVNTVHHKRCSALCWLFMFCTCIVFTGVLGSFLNIKIT